MAKISKDFAVQPNWDRIKELADSSPWTNTEIGMMIGKGHSWLGDGLRKGRMNADSRDIAKLAVLFQCDKYELIVQKEEQEEQQEPQDINEKIMHRLLDIESKVDTILKLLSSLSEGDNKPIDGKTIKGVAKIPRRERAKLLLQELVDEGYGKCLMTTFIKELVSINIGSSYAEQAIADAGYKKGTTGIGQNTTTWILDPAFGTGDENDR